MPNPRTREVFDEWVEKQRLVEVLKMKTIPTDSSCLGGDRTPTGMCVPTAMPIVSEPKY
jgi:hypothetical protein